MTTGVCRAGVVGAGTMGIGIAHALATCGADTVIVEPDFARGKSALTTIEDVLAEGARRGRLDQDQAAAVMGRLRVVPAVEDLEPGLDLVVESVPEDLRLKRRVLAQLETLEPLVLTTNTSSLSIDELASGLRQPDRFCGMHFFNPVWALRLVEVARGSSTSDATLVAVLDWVGRMGKEAAVVRDAPGFATSRLDLCLALEAIRMVEEGVAEPDHIDRAVRLAYRHPVGPLELSDIVGLDVRLDIARSLQASLGPRYAPPALLAAKVAEGDLGRKSGRGFYDWNDPHLPVPTTGSPHAPVPPPTHQESP